MPRRILLLVTDLEIGGTPTVVRELATRLNRPGGVEIEVACLSKWGPVADRIRAAGVPVTAFDARGARDLFRTTRRLRDLVGERKIDTVFSFLVHANVVAALASRGLPGVRFLQSIQTVQPLPRWHWVAQRWAHRYAQRIVVPSRAIVDAAHERSRIPREKFDVVPNAVDPGEFPRVDVFTGPAVRAGYLGRLDKAKSPGSALAALSALPRADFKATELHFYGDGPVRHALEWLVKEGFDAEHVFFHGTVARPQDALARIDVLWQPSRVEGFGLVVIEAMASGVPVVSALAGGVRDILVDGENGLAADPAAPSERFAESVRLLRDDPALRSRLIEGGLRTVREKFTWDVVLPQYRQLLGIDQR